MSASLASTSGDTRQKADPTPSTSDIFKHSARERFRPTGLELIPFSQWESDLICLARPSDLSDCLIRLLLRARPRAALLYLTGNEIIVGSLVQHSGLDIPGPSRENSITN